jgi:glyoxalase family protein
MPLELIVDDHPAPVRFWQGGPVPHAFALRGFHSVTLWVAEEEGTAALLTRQFGYAFVGREGNRSRFRASREDVGLFVDVLAQPNLSRGRMGAGSFHHVAFRARDDQEQLAYQRALAQAGLGVTSVRDRQYFRSTYFREPGGVLFELATDGPGFAIDESVAELGRTLKLPPWLEPQRQAIENALPTISVKSLAPVE